MTSERRKQERTPIWVEATIQTHAASFPAITTEISGDGIRVRCEHSILPGVEVQVFLKLKVVDICQGLLFELILLAYDCIIK